MKKEYWFVLAVYILMQLSSIIGLPLVMLTGKLLGKDMNDIRALAVPIWIVISFVAAFIIILLLLRKEMKANKLDRDAASTGGIIGWSIAGMFLALFAQAIAANIENMLGIKMGSENTKQIIHLIETAPIVILVSSVIGPILEEIVFRKILFGELYKRTNFFIAAIISSVIFALAHGEPQHTILYASMGLTFAFLYVKTKRIIVPIFAHVAMNTFVVLMQSVFKDQIEEFLKNAGKIQSIIGGLF